LVFVRVTGDTTIDPVLLMAAIRSVTTFARCCAHEPRHPSS
jgi:hypothetical protein